MNVRPYLLRAATAVMVLAPFGLSLAAHVTGDPVRGSAASDRPALAFGEYLVNLGRLPDGVSAKGIFRFRNVGAAPLTILGFSPSCGCLKPRLDEPRYAPGAVGAFAVVADTANEASMREDSLKEHYVDVRYDAGRGEQTARVHLKFVLPARHVVVEPRSLLVYQFNDEPTTREIKVTDQRTPPVTILSVECPSDDLVIESTLAESTDDPTRATLAVTIPGTLGNSVRTLLKIRTDDAANPVIYIPIEAFVRGNTPAGVAAGSLGLNDAEERR